LISFFLQDHFSAVLAPVVTGRLPRDELFLESIVWAVILDILQIIHPDTLAEAVIFGG